MAVIIPQVITEDRASGAQVVDGSLRFDSGKSQELTFTPGSDGNLKTATWSFWVKRTKFSSGNDTIFGFGPDAANDAQIYFNSSDKIYIFFRKSSSSQITYQTTRVFRDTGWYHIVMSVDTTQASGQVQLYVNGTEITEWDNSTDTTQNADLIINDATYTNYIGRGRGNVSVDLDCMLSNVYLIDGQALEPEYFGYTDALTGTWRPKKFVKQATPNDGTTWSSDITGTPLNSTVGEAFDGSLSATGAQPDSLLTWTPSSTITAQNQIRLYIYQNGYTSQYGTFEQNGTNLATSIASQLGDGVAGWITLPSNTITELKWSRDTGVGSWILRAVEIDGVTLIDGDTQNIGVNGFYLPFDGSAPIGEDKSGNGNNWTPVNFGGSMELPKATGALPILNTDGGGKTARVGVRTDAYASNLVLALPLVGSNADVSNQINSGSTTKVMTSVGNAAASSDTSNFYGGSFEFDGTGDGITCPDNTDFEFGSGDFTVECWVKQDDTSGFDVYVGKYGGSSNGEFIVGKNGNTPTFYWQDAGGNANINATNFTGNTSSWYHMACVREGDVFTMYINGICENSTTDATTLKSTTNKLTIGIENDESSSPFDGYLQDVRIYKGVAKYSGTTIGTQYFIPASTNPDILPDTPSGVSGGSKLTKITDGAVYFDGTSGTSMSIANSSDFNFGSGDWTVECYHYSFKAPGSGTNSLIGMWNSGSNRRTWLINLYNDYFRGYFSIDGAAGGSIYQVGDSTVKAGSDRWYHVALVRNGNNLYLFQDGKLIDTQDVTGQSVYNNTTDDLYIGSGHAGTVTNTNGYISNLRVVKGTALYTSDFTPPTRELTNVTNTKLLCCQKPTEAMIGFTTATASGALPILNTNDDGTSVTSGNRSDAYSSNLALALPLLNNTNDIHADIKGSGSNKTITTSGNIVASSDSSQLYGGSYIFDGSGYLEVSGTLFGSGPWTFECWLNLDDTGEPFLKVGSNTGATFNISNTSFSTDGDAVARLLYTGQNFGITPNTWFHFALVNDGTNRPIPYVNGIAATGSGDRGTAANTAPAGTLRLGDSRPAGGVLTPYNGYMQDVRLYDVVKYTGNFTPIGTFLRPQAAVSPGSITPNGDAAATNFNPFTTDINAVRGQESGYATLDPLSSFMGNSSNFSLSNGNLSFLGTGSNDDCAGTLTTPTTGKYFFEASMDANPYRHVAGWATRAGIDTSAGVTAFTYYNAVGSRGNNSDSDFDIVNQGTVVTTVSGGTGTVMGYGLDLDNQEAKIFKDGVLVSTTSITTTFGDTWAPVVGDSSTTDASIHVNFGQKPFKFPPPEGFQPLNAANARPSTVIARPDQYFGNMTYSGTSASTATVTSENIKFTPDFVWVKSTSNSEGHAMYDSVRGGENILRSNTNEENVTNANNLKTFIPGGFTTGNNGHVYYNGYNYVSWMWKAGGNKGTFNVDDVGYASASAAGITDGTIALTGASVGTKQGFSILKYTGSGSNGTIAHGLSQAPDFFFGRDLDDTSDSRDWIIYHKTMGNTGRLKFVGNASISESSTFFQNTSPTNSLITVGTSNDINSTNDYIMYCYHDVPGLQKFGGYTGNGSDDGPFIETGFRPALIWTRAYSSNSNNNSHWLIYDTLINPYNESSEVLYANLTNNTNTHPSMGIDILSNGFKLKADSSGYSNYSGWSYIYAAWAEAPTFNLYGAQSNAR